jgi:hypothetical protein
MVSAVVAAVVEDAVTVRADIVVVMLVRAERRVVLLENLRPHSAVALAVDVVRLLLPHKGLATCLAGWL